MINYKVGVDHYLKAKKYFYNGDHIAAYALLRTSLETVIKVKIINTQGARVQEFIEANTQEVIRTCFEGDIDFIQNCKHVHLRSNEVLHSSSDKYDSETIFKLTIWRLEQVFDKLQIKY
jgi:hypothetical protein